ncbi:hypothetical protein LINPERHAP1_LOCUS29902 [Linum perenne]
MEKTFSFGTVKRRLESLWARTRSISVFDVANSFFLVRFSDPTWVRLPKLPIHYFNSLAVTRIGNCIGKTVRLDLATTVGACARYARVCVEVDLSKLLLGKYQLEDKTFFVEYESLETICFSCGIYGHKLDVCVPLSSPHELTEKEVESTPATKEVEKATGECVNVTLKSKGKTRRGSNSQVQNQPSGSRFRILRHEGFVATEVQMRKLPRFRTSTLLLQIMLLSYRRFSKMLAMTRASL